MRYALYIGSAADDKRAAYSWMLVNHTGVVASDVYLTYGERRFDENYGSHAALQKALRKVAQSEGVIQLRLVMDDTIAEAVGFELCGVQAPLYPTICRTTSRILKRFDKYELASFSKDEADASPQEIAVIDDAIDTLQQTATLAGTVRHWRDVLLKPNKIIR